MNRIIILLIISVMMTESFSQSVETDLQEGLYQLVPDWIQVNHLKSDTLYFAKLNESPEHYNQFTTVLFDSIPKKAFYNRNPNKVLISQKIVVDNNHYALVANSVDTMFAVLNLSKEDFGYKYYISGYKKDSLSILETIKRDTTEYFQFTLFSLDEVAQLKKLNDFSEVSKEEFDRIDSLFTEILSHSTQRIKNGKWGAYAGYAIAYEIQFRTLRQSGYNPLIMPGKYSDMRMKFEKKN
ncbi:MAG: hypothetical protein RIA69_19655 [Cyclobacteriaceae bacterium]